MNETRLSCSRDEATSVQQGLGVYEAYHAGWRSAPLVSNMYQDKLQIAEQFSAASYKEMNN